MAKVGFGDWAPDLYLLDTDGANTAQNVLPGANSYVPWPVFASVAAALPATSQGLFCGQRADGTWVFFAGTATKLYRLISLATGWVDVSRLVGGNYACATTDKWSFDQFGTRVIAVNQNDDPQYIDIDSGSNFALLTGSPPRAKIVKVVGDFVFLGNIASFRNRVVWSGFNDSTSWTAGTAQSDYQDFYDGGAVQAIVGGESAFIFQERAIRRASYVPGSSYIFGIEKITEGRGAGAQFGVVKAGQAVFYLAEDGFYSIGGPREDIGKERINRYFKASAEPTWLGRAQAVADPRASRVYLAYRSTDNAQSYYDRLLVYDYALDKLTECTVAITDLAQGASLGVTLENLDSFGNIDTLTISLDSSIWTGGVRGLAAIRYSDKGLGFYQGANDEATLVTPEMQLNPGGRSFVNEVGVMADTTTFAASVAPRETQGGTITYGAESTAGTTGTAPVRSSGRFHRFKVRIPAGTTWGHVSGVDVTAAPDGQR